MATPNSIWTNAREMRGDFADMFNQQAKRSLFDGLVRRVPAPEGFCKITGLYPVGSMEDAVGTPTINGLNSATYNLNTKPRRYSGEIEHELLQKSDAVSRGMVRRIIQDSARIVRDDIDQRLTVILEAGSTPTTGNDIFGDEYFKPTTGKVIPGTSISIINEQSGAWTDSAAEVRAACWTGVSLLSKLRNSFNARIYDDPNSASYVLMYHPNITQFVKDALRPQLLNDAARLDGMIVERANPYLTNADDLYMFVMDGEWEPFVMAERGAPEFRTSEASDESLIFRNGHVWQPYYAAAVGYGSCFSALKLVDS